MLPDVLPAVAFVPSGKYCGHRQGFAFKTSTWGTGYHDDSPNAAPPPPLVTPPKKPVVLQLLRLVMPPVRRHDGAKEVTCAAHLLPLAATAVQQNNDGTGKRRKRTKQRKPRGKDALMTLRQAVMASDDSHRAAGCWAIDTFNGNAWLGACALLNASVADYVALQETR